jgi:hypothetical protein
MAHHSVHLREKVRAYRAEGKTYSEIKTLIGIHLPKSTLSLWCKDVTLPATHTNRISELVAHTIQKARAVRALMQKERKEKRRLYLEQLNSQISRRMENEEVAKIALSMLCLGEASKSDKGMSFCLGNSDPRIINLFLSLLKKCFDFDMEKVRCTVQCRADQEVSELERYWSETTGVPPRLFYKARIDPRTIGKPTRKTDYKGVLRVDYLDRSVQLDLESLADMIYNHRQV